jgi:hypothetical protein
MRHSKTEDIFIRMSSYYSLPTIHSLDSCALLFQPIVALLIACSWHFTGQESRSKLHTATIDFNGTEIPCFTDMNGTLATPIGFASRTTSLAVTLSHDYQIPDDHQEHLSYTHITIPSYYPTSEAYCRILPQTPHSRP